MCVPAGDSDVDSIQLLGVNEIECNDAVDEEYFRLCLPLATVPAASTIPFNRFSVLVTVDDFVLLLSNSSSSSVSEYFLQ